MIVTVFRSRLMPGFKDEYIALVERMVQLAKATPGYISHKGFFADDGERCTIVEFADEKGQEAWRTNAEHLAAQKLGRTTYYETYDLQICHVLREAHSDRNKEAKART